MGILLDTSVAIFALSAPERLGPVTTKLIRTESAMYLSTVSLWEMAIKMKLGKLEVPTPLADIATVLGCTILKLEVQHTDVFKQTDIGYRDPFDRMLVAQATAEGLHLVTTDSKLIDLGRMGILNARH